MWSLWSQPSSRSPISSGIVSRTAIVKRGLRRCSNRDRGGEPVYGSLQDRLAGELSHLRKAGLYKSELEMTTPQGAHVEVAGRGELLNLCANDYLGLANHPAIVAAAHEGLERWGY